MYAEDALFEASFDVYSVMWTGASQVNPECEAVAMKKAMRWAAKCRGSHRISAHYLCTTMKG